VGTFEPPSASRLGKQNVKNDSAARRLGAQS
jgi:hypothetical protein